MRFKSSFVYLESSPLSDVSFANLFPQLQLLFSVVHLVVSRAEVFNFNEVQLTIFSFIGHVFGVVPKKPLSYTRSSRFSPVL